MSQGGIVTALEGGGVLGGGKTERAWMGPNNRSTVKRGRGDVTMGILSAYGDDRRRRPGVRGARRGVSRARHPL